jgi:hypothetical protein
MSFAAPGGLGIDTDKGGSMGLRNSRVEAGLAVSDLDTARRFYEQQLGLVPGEEEQESVRYPRGENWDLRLSLTRQCRQVAGYARGLVRRRPRPDDG